MITMPGNNKLALVICHLYDSSSHILHFSKFTSFINYFKTQYTMNQSNVGIESKINNVIDALLEDLYLIISKAAWDFDIPTQTLQKKINGMSFWSSGSPTNKTLSKAQEKTICKYIEWLNL